MKEIEIVNKLATDCGFPLDNKHYFKKDGVFNGNNVYVYIDKSIPVEEGVIAPTGYPTYIVVNGESAHFMELEEINEYWEPKDNKKKNKEKKKEVGKPVTIQNDDCIMQSQIAGFFFGEGASVWSLLQPGKKLRLIHETTNKHDVNAVAIYYSNTKLGYIPKAQNKPIAELIDQGKYDSIQAYIADKSTGEENTKSVTFKIIKK